MSNGVFPAAGSGGVVVRTVDGTATSPPGVAYAYIPGEDFTSTCAMTALENGCTSRFDPQQMNAVVSELVALAEAFNPTGTWTCGVPNNVAINFAAWATGTGDDTLHKIILDHLAPSADTGNIFTLDNDGFPKVVIPEDVQIIAVPSGTQSISSATWTNFAFGTDVEDTIDTATTVATWDGTTLTIGADGVGLWEIEVCAFVAGTGSVGTSRARLYKNGATQVAFVDGANGTPPLRRTLRLIQGDTIVAQGYQSSGSPVASSVNESFFRAKFLG